MPPTQEHPFRHHSCALQCVWSCWDAAGLTRVTLLLGAVQVGAVVHELADGEESAAALAGVQLLLLGRHKDRLANLQPRQIVTKQNVFLLFGWVFLSSFPPPEVQPSSGWNKMSCNEPSSTNKAWIYLQTWSRKCCFGTPDPQPTSKTNAVFEIKTVP